MSRTPDVRITSAFTVPADVMAGVRRRWPERATGWARQVEHELPQLCARYHAVPRAVMPGRYGFVVAADTPGGGLILRASPDPDADVQARVAWALGELDVSPSLHEIITTDHHTWTVLDEVRPGVPLANADPDVAAIEDLAALLARMTGRPAPVAGMPSIVDWLRGRLDDDALSDLAPGTTVAPAPERRAALSVLDDLSQDAGAALCHADASPWNILSSGTDQWKLVDPRGMSGEVAYDVAVLAIKLTSGLPATTIYRRLAQLANVDAERVRSWALVAAAARV